MGCAINSRTIVEAYIIRAERVATLRVSTCLARRSHQLIFKSLRIANDRWPGEDPGAKHDLSNARYNSTRPRGESSGPDHDLPRLPRAGLRRVKTVAQDGSDPMPWSSSPLPEIFDAEKDRKGTGHDRSRPMEDGVAGVIPPRDSVKSSLVRETSALSFSERTLAILANLNGDDSLPGHDGQIVGAGKTGKNSGTNKFPNRRRSARLEALEEGSQELPVLATLPTKPRPRRGAEPAAIPPVPTTTQPKRNTKPTETDKLSKADAKARREQEKEAEKERKQHLKEQKALEKQRATELAQANRSKTDKKLSTPEMIVDLPESFHDSDTGKQIQSFLRNLGVEMTFYASPIPNVVKWRRKVTAEYNPSKGYWEPVAEYIKDETHALCIMPAQEFVGLVCVDASHVDGQDLDAHVLRFQSRFEGCKLLYLIDGLEKWMRKNKNVRNRAYQAAVLAADEEVDEEEAENEQQGRAKRRGRKKPKEKEKQQYVDEDLVEDALLQLQVAHGCFVHHTSSATETAEWVGIFTQHVSTIPYR